MLTLVASVLYGFYQVFYKRYIALPSESDLTPESARYRQLPDRPSAAATEADEETAIIPRVDDIVYPPPLGLYSNLVTSAIGLCTLLVFWIPIPLLHYYQIESFRLPPNTSTLTAIACIAVSSVAYNAGIMVGPTFSALTVSLKDSDRLTGITGSLGSYCDVGWEPSYHSPDIRL